MLALVVLRKLEFAARRKGVGRERRNRCEYGKALAGKASCCVPIAAICEGGIHGASK